MSNKIDVSMMYAVHNAFRRDLKLFAAHVDGESNPTSHVRAGWENFKNQLLLHHRVEDSHLFPPLRRAVAHRPQDLTLIEQMFAEHAQIEPLLGAVDKALIQENGFAEHSDELATTLNKHLEHEERSALPLIQSVLNPADWKDFMSEMRRQQGIKGAALFVPWILDRTSPDERRVYLGLFPAPVRLINWLFWQSRYERRELWSARE